MIDREDVDSAEIVVRPNYGEGWAIEVPGPTGTSTTYASTQEQALQLAQQLDPNAQIRVLPPYGMRDTSITSDETPY